MGFVKILTKMPKERLLFILVARILITMGNKFPILRLNVGAIIRQPEKRIFPFSGCLSRNQSIAFHRRNNLNTLVVEGIERAAVSDADDDALRQALAGKGVEMGFGGFVERGGGFV